MTNKNQVTNIRATFKKIWGYDDFRPPQGEIVQTILTGKDALIVMPTGGGKSICFQLPALLQNGLTLVVSPLVALMENQVEELKQKHLPAALLHNELSRKKRKENLTAIQEKKLRLLYLSPETLLSPPVWEKIAEPAVEINAIILDEAHCLVQWGETFRPAYRRLGVVRKALLKEKPKGSKIAIAAFTATANPSAQKIITQTLKLENPQAFLINPYRSNLHLKVQIAWTAKCRRDLMLNLIKEHNQQTGLIYVRSRRQSEELAELFTTLNYKTAAYHAGLSPQERREIETSWLSGETQFVVCTSAFGMGINKPDVRWVVHFQAPLLLSEYIQEVGRGGRDGKKADALTLISEPTGILNPSDKQLRQFFLKKLEQQYDKAKQLAKKIPEQGEIAAISQQYKDGEIALSLLHSFGQIEWEDPFNYRRVDNSYAGKIEPGKDNQMNEYLRTKKCRWQFLLDAFGFREEVGRGGCGNCDNCLRRK